MTTTEGSVLCCQYVHLLMFLESSSLVLHNNIKITRRNLTRFSSLTAFTDMMASSARQLHHSVTRE